MSVLIKGMKMPDSCHVCVAGYGGCCYVAPPESDGICPDHGRTDWCPLIEIPPHGRLIDADALPWIEGRDEHDNPTYLLIKNCVDVLPTIIPAEEGET